MGILGEPFSAHQDKHIEGKLSHATLAQRETDPGAIASSLCIVRPETNRVLAAFLLLYFDSSLGERMIRKYDNGTAQPNLSATDLGKYLVPVPSLGEQREVLLKVDQLMKVCDDLESRLTRAEERASKLVEAVVQELVA